MIDVVCARKAQPGRLPKVKVTLIAADSDTIELIRTDFSGLMQHNSELEVDVAGDSAPIKRSLGSSLRRFLDELRLLVRWAPFDTSTEAGRSKERYRRVGLTTLTSVGARGLAVSVSLLTVPLTLSFLGKERYGLWMTISSALAMLSFADFGMGNGLLNAIARASGENDHEALRKFVSTGFFLMTGIALLIAFVFAGAYPSVQWPNLFNVTTDLARRESGPAVLALAACFIVNLPLGIVQRIQIGFQEGFINDIWQCSGSLLSLAAVLVGIHLGWGLPFLILAVAGAPVTAAVFNGISLFGFSRPWLLPNWKSFQYTTARVLASNGFLFFLLQIGSVVAFSSDNLIVAQMLGASAVPQYALVQKVFLLPAILQTAWLGPLWPAYGEAIHRGDHAWVRRTLKRSILTVSLATALSSGILVAVSRPLFTFWVGKGFVPSWSLIIGFALFAVLQGGASAVAMYLNGSNALAFQLSLSFAYVVLSIPMKVLFCKHVGIEGIVWASVIGYGLLVAVPYVLRLPKLIAKQERYGSV